MSDTARYFDDLDAYLAKFGEDERRELAQADAALDLSILLQRAREERHLTQTAAAQLSGVKQQAISRWENSHPDMKLGSLRRYLEALGYGVDLLIRDLDTGEILNPAVLEQQAGQSATTDDHSATEALA